MEHGFTGADALGREYNQVGNFFMLGAAQEWQAIVDRNAAILRGAS
jgi:hypothetical protein